MMKVEKYTLKDGESGWLAHIRKKKQNRQLHVLTRRFSCEQYGEAAFQKALTWVEDHHNTSAHP